MDEILFFLSFFGTYPNIGTEIFLMIPSYFKIEILAIQDEFVVSGRKGLNQWKPCHSHHENVEIYMFTINYHQSSYSYIEGSTSRRSISYDTNISKENNIFILKVSIFYYMYEMKMRIKQKSQKIESGFQEELTNTQVNDTA